MILSHRHKFIFLKTNKTAGTSVEIALAEYCGEDDIITPISPEDEKLRQGLGFRGPQNHVRQINNRSVEFYNHMSAAEVIALIGTDTWSSYYKFCFERNPWDRAVSYFYWCKRHNAQLELAGFFRSGALNILKERGIRLYSLNGRIAVDRVCSYEYIADELRFLEKKLGIPGELKLPRTKSGFRKPGEKYQDILGVEQREMISGLFSDEIRLYGYQY